MMPSHPFSRPADAYCVKYLPFVYWSDSSEVKAFPIKDVAKNCSLENDSGPSETKEWEVSYAGIVRSVFSSITRRSTQFLRAGIKIRPKTFAQSTDRFKELLEFREHYLEDHESPEPSHTNQQQSKLKRITKEVLPGFLKHVLYATIVFSAYENLYDDYYLSYYQREHNNHNLVSLLGPFICGGVAGGFGGLFHRIWDSIVPSEQHYYRSSPNPASHVINIKHSLPYFVFSQAILFSSFEFMKWVSLTALPIHSSLTTLLKKLPSFVHLEHGEDHHHSSSSSSSSSLVADILCISLSGGVAGIVMDGFHRFYRYQQLVKQFPEQKQFFQDFYEQLLNEHKEEEELKKQRKSFSTWRIPSFRYWRTVLMPSSASWINAALPMSLTFIAYEYGKEHLQFRSLVSS
jgi:hypothetical protein